MKMCPNCGKITNSRFCPDCGVKIPDVDVMKSAEEEVVKETTAANDSHENFIDASPVSGRPSDAAQDAAANPAGSDAAGIHAGKDAAKEVAAKAAGTLAGIKKLPVKTKAIGGAAIALLLVVLLVIPGIQRQRAEQEAVEMLDNIEFEDSSDIDSIEVPEIEVPEIEVEPFESTDPEEIRGMFDDLDLSSSDYVDPDAIEDEKAAETIREFYGLEKIQGREGRMADVSRSDVRVYAVSMEGVTNPILFAPDDLGSGKGCCVFCSVDDLSDDERSILFDLCSSMFAAYGARDFGTSAVAGMVYHEIKKEAEESVENGFGYSGRSSDYGNHYVYCYYPGEMAVIYVLHD